MLKTLYPTWKQFAAIAGQFLLAPEKLALGERLGTTRNHEVTDFFPRSRCNLYFQVLYPCLK